MERRCARYEDVALTTDPTTGTALGIGDSSGGMIYIPAAASSITSLTYYVCDSSTGTFLALYDATVAAVTQTVSNTKAYELPAAIFAAKFLKVVANAAGTVSFTFKS